MIRLILQCVYTEKSLVGTRLFPILLIKEKNEKKKNYICFIFTSIFAHRASHATRWSTKIFYHYYIYIYIYIRTISDVEISRWFFYHALACTVRHTHTHAHIHTHTNQSETAVTFIENVFYKNSFLKSVQTHAAFVYVYSMWSAALL